MKGGGSLLPGKEKTQTMVVMNWTETETMTTFSLPSFTVSLDAHAETEIVDARTARYEKLKDSHKDVDGFASTFSQTLNNPMKHQNEAAVPVTLVEGGCQTSSYEIDDAMNSGTTVEEQLVGMGDADVDDPAGLTTVVREFVTDIVNVAKVSPGCLLDPEDRGNISEGCSCAIAVAKDGAADERRIRLPGRTTTCTLYLLSHLAEYAACTPRMVL